MIGHSGRGPVRERSECRGGDAGVLVVDIAGGAAPAAQRGASTKAPRPPSWSGPSAYRLRCGAAWPPAASVLEVEGEAARWLTAPLVRGAVSSGSGAPQASGDGQGPSSASAKDALSRGRPDLAGARRLQRSP